MKRELVPYARSLVRVACGLACATALFLLVGAATALVQSPASATPQFGQ